MKAGPNEDERMRQADRTIDRNGERYDRLLKEKGFEAARDAAVDDLMAAAFWLDKVAGTKGTYDLLQELADRMIAPH